MNRIPSTEQYILFRKKNHSKLSSRTKKILALIPPPTTVLDSSSDAENKNTRSDLSDETSSEAPSLPSDVKMIFENLTETDSTTEGECQPCTSQTPMKETFSGNIIETPQSIFTPIKTRLQRNSQYEKNSQIEENLLPKGTIPKEKNNENLQPKRIASNKKQKVHTASY
ncbi:hypothetical protein JTB14_029902 [Gonioctena quinquepunctata]|nr:hypothetical protein JTB14_029902 [Gonioctena quinquepunctata]